jgi:transcriptional regulator with XRE-family HTH domain
MAGARLRALRERFDLSLEEAGQALGLSAEEVQARELGAQPFRVRDLWRLCHYLGVPPAEVYTALAEPGGQSLGARALKVRRKLLGATLSDLREERGLSAGEAAERVGWSERFLQQAEQGAVDLEVSQLEALARLYGCACHSLLGAEKEDATSRVPPPKAEDPGLRGLATDVAEFLRRPDAERYVRAAMALSGLESSALAALEDALLFLRGSD